MTDSSSLNQICADACRRGDVTVVKQCFDDGIDIDGTDDVSGRNWLHLSIWYPDDVALLNWLLERGVPIEPSAMVAAAARCKPDCVSALLDAGADPNATIPLTEETGLHMAASFGFEEAANECVQRLLDAGADPNVNTATRIESGTWATGVYTMGETPLHLAATFGDEAMVRLLVDAGADIHAEDGYGHTPIVWCARARRSEKHRQVSADRLIAILRGHPENDWRFKEFLPLVPSDERHIAELEAEVKRLTALLRANGIRDTKPTKT